MLKVLLETISKRKGLKFFENKDEMNDYLGNHFNQIASYEVIQEDEEDSPKSILEALCKDCEIIHIQLLRLIEQQKKLENKEAYLKIMSAAGQVYDCVTSLKECIKEIPLQ